MRLTLSGLPWTAWSPSVYELQGYPVLLCYNSRAWYLSFDGQWNTNRPWPSRDAAAAAIAAAFLEHRQQERGLV
jgi:hypothetical protein